MTYGILDTRKSKRTIKVLYNLGPRTLEGATYTAYGFVEKDNVGVPYLLCNPADPADNWAVVAGPPAEGVPAFVYALSRFVQLKQGNLVQVVMNGYVANGEVYRQPVAGISHIKKALEDLVKPGVVN